MLYFAYGSNMDAVQMAGRCPGSRSLGRARLPGGRLSFTGDSAFWGGGVGTVQPAPGEEVWGVLWELDAAGEASLDRYEGVAKGIYRKEDVEVISDDGPRTAMVYVCNHTRYRRPSTRYVTSMLEAARAHDFPAEYVAGLAALL